MFATMANNPCEHKSLNFTQQIHRRSLFPIENWTISSFLISESRFIFSITWIFFNKLLEFAFDTCNVETNIWTKLHGFIKSADEEDFWILTLIVIVSSFFFYFSLEKPPNQSCIDFINPYLMMYPNWRSCFRLIASTIPTFTFELNIGFTHVLHAVFCLINLFLILFVPPSKG